MAIETHLSGAHVLITGGARYLGRAMTEGFLRQGANVSYCGRSVTGKDFADFQDAVDGAQAVGTVVDISQPDQIEAWVAKSAEKFGRIDVVVANANAKYKAPDVETWRKSFDSDIVGLITLINACTPHLEKTAALTGGTTSIIVMSSLAGFEARDVFSGGPYTTFKRAQATLAKDLVRTLGPRGIRINTVVPGTVDSPQQLPDGSWSDSRIASMRETQPERVAQLESAPALGRLGRPEDMVNVALFLGSHLSSYITGANLLLDGGTSSTL